MNTTIKKYLLLMPFWVVTMSFSQDMPLSAFLEKWENSKAYMLEIARAMPAGQYSYKPTERQKTFGEQLLHIKQNMDWLSTTYFMRKPLSKTAPKKAYHTKAQIIAALKEAFENTHKIIKKVEPEELKEVVDFFAGPKTKLQILNLLQDHVTHHRGQLIVYLNLQHIAPPKYRGW